MQLPNRISLSPPLTIEQEEIEVGLWFGLSFILPLITGFWCDSIYLVAGSFIMCPTVFSILGWEEQQEINKLIRELKNGRKNCSVREPC